MAVEPAPLSATNPRLASLRRLSGRRRARLDEGRFVVEGPVPVGEALAAGALLDELYVDADAWAASATDSALRRTIEQAAGRGVPVWSLEPGLLATVSDTVNPQGLVAVAPRRTAPIADVCTAPGPVLALVDLADPGNLGTLVRAAEAAGGAGVVVSGTTTDPFGPKAVRAAAGSLMRLPVAEVGDPIEMVEAIRRCGRLVVATVAAGGSAPDSLDLTGPLALVVGSEAHGLSDALIARCDTTSTIPLAASVESLNAAVAGSIVLFEVARQRRRAELRPGGDRSPRTDWTPDSPTDRLDDR